MEDWAEIRRLRRAEGMAIQAIARRLGVARNTVKKALASDRPPQYRRAVRGSVVDVVEPQIRALLAEFPDMPTSVIMERIGWAHGKTVFYDRVAQLRLLFCPADPASRTEYQTGELARGDLWFPPVDVPLVRAGGAAAGAGDGVGLFAHDRRGDDPLPGGCRSAGRAMVAVHRLGKA